MRGYSPRSSGMYPNRARSSIVIALSFQVTAPLSKSTSPNTERMAVVLPAPFGPRNPVIRPGRAVKVQPSSAQRAPNVLVAARNSSIPLSPSRSARVAVIGPLGNATVEPTVRRDCRLR